MSHKISPSILSADFGSLGKEIEMINASNADWLHCDIMDGVFVPNISFGFPILEIASKISTKPLDVHLMIIQPEKFISRLKDLNIFMLSVHYEACIHLHRTIQQIKEAGMKASVTLNPHTPVFLLKDILSDLDMVLLMSVNPGFGGQKFIEHTLKKVSELKDMISAQNTETLIEVDGGVNLETGRKLLDAGADVLVAGNFVFNSSDPIQTIQELKSL